MKLYLDSNIIIYAYEAANPLQSAVRSRLWQWCANDGGGLVTSLFTRLECLVAPRRAGNQLLLSAYETFFGGGSVEIVQVSLAVIDLATELRATYGFRSPDAVHLASAVHAGANRFLTADARLQRCAEIPVEVLLPS